MGEVDRGGSRETGKVSNAAITRPTARPAVAAIKSLIGTWRSALRAARAGAITSQGASAKPNTAPSKVHGTITRHVSVLKSVVPTMVMPISQPIKPYKMVPSRRNNGPKRIHRHPYKCGQEYIE